MRKSLTWAAVGTTVAAAALSVAGTASAATATPRTTSLSIEKSVRAITAGEAVTISGQLKSGATAVDHQGVWLNWVGRNGGLHHITEGTTHGPAGDVSFKLRPEATTTYELTFIGAAGYGHSHSGKVTVPVAKLGTTLSISAPTTPIHVGTKETFTGTLESAGKPLSGRLVWLFTLNSRKQVVHVAGHGTTSAAGTVAITTTPALGTDWYALVYGGTWQYARSVSHIDKVVVTKVPTTLVATEAAGKTAGTETITGTLKAGSAGLNGKTVTLRYENSKGAWVTLRSNPTKDGVVTFTVKPGKATTYDLTFGGTPVYAHATSNTVIAG
jgi:hypothetical protein